MGNKDMRSEINQVHQIFATLMGFIGVILVFLLNFFTKYISNTNILVQQNNSSFLFYFFVYFTSTFLFIILETLILYNWINKIYSISSHINNYITSADILLPLNVSNIILSIFSVYLVYYITNITINLTKFIDTSILIVLYIASLLSFSPIAVLFDIVKFINNKYPNKIKYFNIKNLTTIFYITIAIIILALFFFCYYLYESIGSISFLITLNVLALISIFYSQLILVHENITVLNNNTDSNSTSSSENNTVKQNPNKGEPKNPTTNSDSTPLQ